MHVHIVGAGPCGLLIAYRLLQQGAQVSLYDQMSKTGGCWATYKAPFREHSPRTITGAYRTLFSIIKELHTDPALQPYQAEIAGASLREFRPQDYPVLLFNLLVKSWDRPVKDFAEGLHPSSAAVLQRLAAVAEETWARTPMRTIITAVDYMGLHVFGTQFDPIRSFDEILPLEKLIRQLGGNIFLGEKCTLIGDTLVTSRGSIKASSENPVVMATNGAQDELAEPNATVSRNIQFHLPEPLQWTFENLFKPGVEAQVITRTSRESPSTISCVLLNSRDFPQGDQAFAEMMYEHIRSQDSRLPEQMPAYSTLKPHRPWLVTDARQKSLPLVRGYVFWPSFLNPGVPVPVNILEGALQAGELCAAEILLQRPRVLQPFPFRGWLILFLMGLMALLKILAYVNGN